MAWESINNQVIAPSARTSHMADSDHISLYFGVKRSFIFVPAGSASSEKGAHFRCLHGMHDTGCLLVRSTAPSPSAMAAIREYPSKRDDAEQ